MASSSRFVFLLLLLILSGCTGRYYKQHLGSHLPKADGSMLDVDCYSYVEHNVSSISPTLGTEPAVTIIMDDWTFIVTAVEIRLNDERQATVPTSAKNVVIEVTEAGFEIAIDGKPAGQP